MGMSLALGLKFDFDTSSDEEEEFGLRQYYYTDTTSSSDSESVCCVLPPTSTVVNHNHNQNNKCPSNPLELSGPGRTSGTAIPQTLPTLVDLTGSDSEPGNPTNAVDHLSTPTDSSCKSLPSSEEFNPADFLEVELKELNTPVQVPGMKDNDSKMKNIKGPANAPALLHDPPEENLAASSSTQKEENESGMDGEDEEDVYVVEKILAKRVRKGKPFYLLKWANYPEDHNSWESLDNLACPDLLAEFEKEWEMNQGKKTTTTAAGRKRKRTRKSKAPNAKIMKPNSEDGEGSPEENKNIAAAILRSLRRTGNPHESSTSPV